MTKPKHNYTRLQREIKKLPETIDLPTAELHEDLKAYIDDCWNKGKAELKENGKLGKRKTAGYSSLLGNWTWDGDNLLEADIEPVFINAIFLKSTTLTHI